MKETRLAGLAIPVSRAGLKINTGMTSTIVDGRIVKCEDGAYRWQYDVLMSDGSIIKCYPGRNQIGNLQFYIPPEESER